MGNIFYNDRDFERHFEYAQNLHDFAESRIDRRLDWRLHQARKDGTNIFSAIYESQEGTEWYELEVRLTIDRKTHTCLYEVIQASENLKAELDFRPIQT